MENRHLEKDQMNSMHMRADSFVVPPSENFEMVDKNNLTSRLKTNKPSNNTADKRGKVPTVMTSKSTGKPSTTLKSKNLAAKT